VPVFYSLIAKQHQTGTPVELVEVSGDGLTKEAAAA
jgi:hypothetical protein